MDFTVANHRIFAEDSAGRLLAEVTFPLNGDGCAVIDHTFVDDSLRGQGVAGALLLAAAAELRRRGVKAHAQCSYAVTWFQKHPEYADLLAPKQG